MIHDVDESLRALLERDVLDSASVEVSFEAPNDEWAAKRSGPALNLYLYDIREDLTRRRVQPETRLDEHGVVVERRVPPRRFKLSYLVTAWTQRAEDEHRLLSAVLACFLQADALPEEVLHGGLAEADEQVRSTIALPLPPERSLADVWTALGAELRPSLDLVVTTPVPPRTPRRFEVGPPVIEEPRFELSGSDGQHETVQQGLRGGDPREGPPEPVPPIEEEFVGGRGDDEKGRRFKIRSLP